MSSTPESQASTKTGGQAVLLHDGYKSKRRQASENAVHAATSRDVLLFLAAFRILNALSIRTFFQPDEFFQSLEPAWQMAFGRDSGAWITWVLSMARQLRVTY
jgi:phosphatidylinositol glycan class B